MLNDKKRAEFQQSLAGINEVMPAMWWCLYSGCLEQGFSPMQSLLLVQTQILASCTSGINGTSGQAPDEKPKDDE